MLLRLSRKKARPEIKELPASALVPFLAVRQGLLGHKPNACETAFLKTLSAYTAPVKLWETEIFTARCANYSPEIIDREIQKGSMVWYGNGKEKLGFCPPDDLYLAGVPVFANNPKQEKNEPEITEAFTQAIQSGFFDHPRSFWEIKDKMLTETHNKLQKVLWEKVWQGQLSSDSFEPVRRGLEIGFTQKNTEMPESLKPDSPFSPQRARIPRALRDRWKEGAPVRGGWFSLAVDEIPADNKTQSDPLDEEYKNRDRVRLLLTRWGILCRPFLEHESPPFTWSGLLPAMRRMELSGELVAGRFFSGINSLQFTSPAVIRELEKINSYSGIYWMNAADPASPAGLNIDELDTRYPARMPSSHLYFRGKDLIAVSNKNGKELQIFIEAEDLDIPILIDLIKIPRSRKVLPEKKITVEKINGSDAAKTNYAPAFVKAGFIGDRGRLYFW